MPSKNLDFIYRVKFNKFTSYSILFISLILFILVIYFLLNSYGISLLNFGNNENIAPFFIADQCSYLAGQLLHTINIADECSLKCRSECSVLKREYANELFALGNNTCNSCQCMCK